MNVLLMPKQHVGFVPPVGATSTTVLLETRSTTLFTIGRYSRAASPAAQKEMLKRLDKAPAAIPTMADVAANNTPLNTSRINEITESLRAHLASLKRGGNRKDVVSFFSLIRISVAIQHLAAVRVDLDVLSLAWNGVMDVMNRTYEKHGEAWDSIVVTLKAAEMQAFDNVIDYHAAQLKCLSLAEYKKAHDLATRWDTKAVYNVLNSENKAKEKQCSQSIK